MTARQLVQRLRPYVPALVIAAAALGLAWTFAVGVLQHTRPFGLPLDDSYIYLTYAKQFGRGEPFTYFPGGGYSAGSTSVLWPMLLAPFWTVGARGHALVWVSYGLCAALYAITLVGCYRLVRELVAGWPGQLAGVLAAALVLGVAPFAWTSLAGMEVGFASALLVLTLILIVRAPRNGPPSKRLVACLAATSLSRPEALMIVVFIVGVVVVTRVRARELRAAAWWLVPLIPPLAWLTANKLLAGNWFPNTGVAKSHFYLPGFDLTYWWTAITTQSGRMLRGLFWDGASPLVWPRLVAVLWLVGAVRVVAWAREQRRYLAGLLLVTSPFGLSFAVIASSGAWSFQNYRYIAPAFPLLLVVVALGLVPPPLPARWRVPAIARPLWAAATVLLVLGYLRAALPGMRADIALFAQNATDLNRQVVTLGHEVKRRIPGASLMFHDAGAVAYYGDTRVYDMLGLVTNYQTGVANHGPGSRFEFLESLPPERRPTHFTYYPAWMGQGEMFGEVLRSTPLAPPFHHRRLVGDQDMQLIVARWDHVHTAERPLVVQPGWHVVDRLDLADLASERAHAWRGDLGRRRFGDPTARWTVFHKETHPDHGLLLDGGRTLRGGSETFTLALDPSRPVRLVLRTGGKRDYPWHEALAKPVVLELLDAAGTAVARADLPVPSGALVEVAFEIAPSAIAGASWTVRTRASGPYRAFHWFVLQPDRGP
ncbi:MAG: hypothetical protein M3680_11945 [Myxococcota bacterium]|nr:hypothetical protein [Myxococcota bacterium]